MHTTVAENTSSLALLGGHPAVEGEHRDLFAWPIITEDDERAVLRVLRKGDMSGLSETLAFEQEFAQWQGVEHAVGFCNGTASLQAAMYACGVGAGDEVIGPSLTYWASVAPCFSLGATVVFADIDAESLCIDPADIEHRITPRTKAVVVVHNYGHPADMDAIMAIARRHGVKVIEDFSHAQGGHYRGRKIGSIGDVGATSLMSKKSLAVGEAGMLVTNDPAIRDRAIAWAHHARFTPQIDTAELRPLAGVPLGGVKGRMHQLSAAMGRVQLQRYDERCREIRAAMGYFWELLDGVPGIRPHRVKDPGSDMAGWYSPTGHYVPEELGGLSVAAFARAVKAEGATCSPGGNRPLHLHPLFVTGDIYGHGKPTRVAHAGAADRDRLLQGPGSLPVSEGIVERMLKVPWFKHNRRDVIERFAAAYRKVAEHYADLLPHDPGNPPTLGGWMSSAI